MFQTMKKGGIPFAHSIIGIITICFAVIQALMGLICRPPLESSSRFVFNMVHATFGYITVTLAG